jgi:glutathione S-transferase
MSQIRRLHRVATPPSAATRSVIVDFKQLGKISVRVPYNGTQLFDSGVIVEYLGTVSPVSRLIPEPPRQRIAIGRWETLADRICDATAAFAIESPGLVRQPRKDWLARQQATADRGVRALRSIRGASDTRRPPCKVSRLFV